MDHEILQKNEQLKQVIMQCNKNPGKETSIMVLETLRRLMNAGGQFLIPVETPANSNQFAVCGMTLQGGQEVLAAFTDDVEANKRKVSTLVAQPIAPFLKAAKETEQIDGVVINPWGESFFLPKKWIEVIFTINSQEQQQNQAKKHIRFAMGDITKLDCECIVNAANKTLLGGGGVDGAIHRAAGPELLAECRTLGGCETGQAKITKGYNLKAKYVIHTVGPIYSGKDEDQQQLHNCYRNSLELAKEHDIHRIAFPAISTGVYGYPLEKAVPIALITISQWLDRNPNYGMDVTLCCFDQKTYDMYQAFVRQAQVGETRKN